MCVCICIYFWICHMYVYMHYGSLYDCAWIVLGSCWGLLDGHLYKFIWCLTINR